MSQHQKRGVVTARDIEDAARAGRASLEVPGGALITDEAREQAERLGVRLGREGSAAVRGNGNGSDRRRWLEGLAREALASAYRTPEVATVTGQPAERKLLIGGRWVEAAAGGSFEVLDPATNQRLALVAEAGLVDVEHAVLAAREAFENGPWASLDAPARARCLYRVARLLEERQDELAAIESRNVGKPIADARRGDIPMAVDTFEYYAGVVTKLEGKTIPVPGSFLNYTLREPLGVVALIVPWNFPLVIACWKLAPALAAGNTVILKPSSLTPLSALELGRICLDAGIPPGVVNVLPGPGGVVGEALASHPDVAKVAFTGETATGRLIARAGAESIKKVSLELGGKSPNLVFADADIDQAVNGALFGIFLNMGEVCAAGSRILVQRDIHDEFLERLIAKTARLRVGAPSDPSTQVGPLVSRQQLARVQRSVESARAQGARVVYGGRQPDDPALRAGNYYLPTILDDVRPGMDVARYEIFGPVASVLTFGDVDEAVRLANASDYGLAAGIWTKDIKRAHQVARRLKVGNIWINTYNLVPASAPFGGYKQSGIGRDLGLEALDLYLQTKNVCVDLNDKSVDWFGLD